MTRKGHPLLHLTTVFVTSTTTAFVKGTTTVFLKGRPHTALFTIPRKFSAEIFKIYAVVFPHSNKLISLIANNLQKFIIRSFIIVRKVFHNSLVVELSKYSNFFLLLYRLAKQPFYTKT